MKADLKKLLKRFDTAGIKKGDLVVTFEIHRVMKMEDGRFEVATIYPECTACGNRECIHPHFMWPGEGQHGIAKLKC